jgi:Sap, sulfolipid-1-addressing protein
VVTGAIYIAVAASTVAIPVLAYVAAGHRLDDSMARLKEWMDRNNGAMLAVVLVLIGGLVLYHGVDALL